jgi:hypothetical protein
MAREPPQPPRLIDPSFLALPPAAHPPPGGSRLEFGSLLPLWRARLAGCTQIMAQRPVGEGHSFRVPLAVKISMKVEG